MRKHNHSHGSHPHRKIPVNEPIISPEATSYVIDAMSEGWVSSAGPVVRLFEQRFAEYMGLKHAITTSCGTAALHLALQTLRLRPGDEVILPDFTMISTVCAVLYTGATPVFIDSDPDTFTINVDMVTAAITSRTKAILPVHIYGHAADMDPILELAASYNLAVIEDAAEAHGATYKKKLCGSLGDIGCFSFYGNKIITTGEGGMIVTDNDEFAAHARRLKDMSHDPECRFRHKEMGFSYRMSSLQAACGVGQLEHIEAFLDKKRLIAAQYRRRLSGIRGLRLPITKPWAGCVYWMFTVLLEESFPLSREAFCTAMSERGVETRNFFLSSNSQPLVQDLIGDQGPFKVSEKIAEQGLYLPSGLALTVDQIEYVCNVIRDIVE